MSTWKVAETQWVCGATQIDDDGFNPLIIDRVSATTLALLLSPPLSLYDRCREKQAT